MFEMNHLNDLLSQNFFLRGESIHDTLISVGHWCFAPRFIAYVFWAFFGRVVTRHVGLKVQG